MSAVNQFGEGESASASATPVTVPLAPRDLVAVGGVNNVTLTWSGPASDGGSGILGYMVYRMSGSGTVVYLATVVGTTYLDDDLVDGVRYAYQVRAVNALGVGEPSPTMSATTVDAPSAVTSLSAVPGIRSVALSWSEPLSDGGSEVLGYYVFRNGALVATVLVAEFSDSGLSNGVSYLYDVVAFNALGVGPTTMVAATTTALPGPVSDLAATPGNAQAVLTWVFPPTGAFGYNVYRWQTGESPVLIQEVTGTFCLDTGLTNGVLYHYRVEAKNAAGPGPGVEISCTPGTMPSSPTYLTATIGDGVIGLSWSAPAQSGGSEVTAYRVYRSTSAGGPWAHLATVTSSIYTDPAVMAGVTFYYRVSAVNVLGEGLPCDEVQSAVPAPPALTPSAPSGLTASEVPGGIRLTWAAPSEQGGSAITGYRVYRSTGAGAPELIATVPASVTSYSDLGVVEGGEYSYWVAAENSEGVGAMPITSVTGTPGVQASSGGGSDTLWVAIIALVALQAVTLGLVLLRKRSA